VDERDCQQERWGKRDVVETGGGGDPNEDKSGKKQGNSQSYAHFFNGRGRVARLHASPSRKAIDVQQM